MKKRCFVILATIVAAYASLVYELAAAEVLVITLGNATLRYSTTIGCFLAAMGIGAILANRTAADPLVRLARLEVFLALLGGLSAVGLLGIDLVHRSFSPSLLGDMSTVLMAYSIPFGIGVLSGMELPLLITIGSQKGLRPGEVLGVDYFGSLAGSVSFPLLLLPALGAVGTSLLTGALNGLLAAALYWRAGRLGKVGIALTVSLCLMLAALSSRSIERLYLERFYSSESESATILHSHRSKVQRIDIVRTPDQLGSQQSLRLLAQPSLTDDFVLFLDGRWQVLASVEAYYHETMTRIALEQTQRGTTAVVLGGGDGLLAKRLIEDNRVDRVLLVEYDHKIVELGRTQPLVELNGDVFSNEKLEVTIGDAFSWLRRCPETPGVMLLDFPLPFTRDVARLYTTTMYEGVCRCALSGAVVIQNIPDSAPEFTSLVAASMIKGGLRDLHMVRPVSSKTVVDSILQDRGRLDKLLDEVHFALDGLPAALIPEAEMAQVLPHLLDMHAEAALDDGFIIGICGNGALTLDERDSRGAITVAKDSQTNEYFEPYIMEQQGFFAKPIRPWN